MKKFLPFLASLLLASVSWGQTGNGVILLTDASYTFTPTTVDSSSTFNVQLKNTVGIAQTVFFGGLDAPFVLSNNDPIEVASQDTIDFSITFTPSAIGSFSDTLEVIGNVFGSASLVVSGDGIQVQLEWTPGTLAFDTTAIGQTNSQILALSSVGDGAAVISSIDFSNDIFSVDSALSSFNIAEGTSENIVVNYAPVNAGAVNAAMTLHTNDPTNTTIEIALTAVGISEVSGEICDITWTLINSPYTLVGDVVVPEGCTLNIDPGVEVIGQEFDFNVSGALQLECADSLLNSISVKSLSSTGNIEIGNSSNGNCILNATENITLNQNTSIYLDSSTGGINCGGIISIEGTATFEGIGSGKSMITCSEFNSHGDLTLSNCMVQESGTSDYPGWYLNGNSLSDFAPPFENENSQNHLGRFYEDFTDLDAQGWDWGFDSWSCVDFEESSLNSGNIVQTVRNCDSGQWGWIRATSPEFQMNEGESPASMSVLMDTYNMNWGHSSSYIDYRIEYRVNGGTWTYLVNSGSYLNYQTVSYDLTSVNATGQTIQFRFSGYFRYYGRLTIDNFDFRTNLYDEVAGGTDIPASELSAPIQDVLGNGMSTGGVRLIASEWNGDFQTVGDSIVIYIVESEISPGNKTSHGLGIYGDAATVELFESSFRNHTLDGVHIEVNDLNLEARGVKFELNGQDGTEVKVNSSGSSTFRYCKASMNNGTGFNCGYNAQFILQSTLISQNGNYGIAAGAPITLNHSNVVFNDNTGLKLTRNLFHSCDNSILWGNNNQVYTQIDIAGGVISTSHSTVQGRSSYGAVGNGQYYWGEGTLEADPLFADDDLHLEIFSPCVDGGQPWHQDAYMPFGLGGVRADMGMYGGPDNAYWGGEALPDGASALTGVSDSPQDQGGVVGLVFDASFYDNSDLVNNVTSYAFWRHYDPTGQSIGTLDEGNWELIGEMPSQSFNGYAYQAQTLGNTNAFGTFNSCYTVVAHTDDPDTYWYSNVLCGESIDNLAPSEPDLGGMVLETGGVTVFWELPSEEDYAYTEVTSDAGFSAEVTGDTLAVDLTAELGGTYIYTAVHYDVNGNASDPASLTLELEPGVDVITLNAGWNLISTDRAVTQGVDEVFAGLAAGNLQYVTGFDGGVQFYDPNGLSFLNTLGSLTPGNGYWVKVAADDVLEVSGVRLAEDFMPGLAEGWNLVGYAAEAPAAPGDVFAELEATGDLLYVTGFDEGVEVYDPNGLPFLNTLTEMRNGFGYWVKSAVATDGDVLAPLAGDVLPAEMPTPRYDVVNGVSELGAYAGEFVDVVNGWGVTVARLPILEGGHLMTTALFGDDPATGAVEGLADGEELHFAFRGAMANETLVFGGDMAHKTLSLTFDEVDGAMGVFPNPASDVATFRFQVDMDAQVELTLVDLAGRQVAVLLDANKGAGTHAETLALPALEAGAYTVQLRVAGEVAGTQRLVVTH